MDEYSNRQAVCGWCSRSTVMIPIEGTAYLRNDLAPTSSDRPGHQAYRCAGCQAPSIAHGIFDVRRAGAEPTYFTPLSWFPKGALTTEYPDSVPEQIAKVAQEAHGCLDVGHIRGAVALARAVVESSAKAKGITSGTLMQKIDKLYDQGCIYEHVKDAAHEVREGGNEIAHGDLVDDPLTEEEAEAIVELMDMVLDGVFIAPAKSAAQKKARLARKNASQQGQP